MGIGPACFLIRKTVPGGFVDGGRETVKGRAASGRPVTESAKARALHALEGHHPLSYAIVLLIALNVAAVIAESVEEVHAAYGRWFDAFEWLSLAVFSAEYVVRLWAAPANPKYAGPLGRARYVVSPMALVDLVAILPSFLLLAKVLPAVDLRALRAVRFFRFARLLRVLKLGRYSSSAQLLAKVIHDRRADLAVALGGVGILLILASSLLYAAEHDAQPDKFSSIPAAMWWAIITLTTIGYGDVYPVTTFGKLLGAATALLGVMIVAIPAAIMSAGFIEELQQQRQASVQVCPHCGKDVRAPPETVRVAVQDPASAAVRPERRS